MNKITALPSEFDIKIKGLISSGKMEDAILMIMYVISRESHLGYIDEHYLLDRVNKYMIVPYTQEDLKISIQILLKEKKISPQPHDSYLRQN